MQNSKLDYCGISEEIIVPFKDIKVFSATMSNKVTAETQIKGLYYDYAVPDTIKIPEFTYINVWIYNANNEQLYYNTYLSSRSSTVFNHGFFGVIGSYGLQLIMPELTGINARTIRLFLCKTYAFEPFTSYDHAKINIKIGGIPNE